MSADPNDRASELEELARQDALANSRRAAAPKPTGCCLYCGERLPMPQRWCDADCRSEYDDEQDALRRRGKVKQ